MESGSLIGALVAVRIFRRGDWGWLGSALAGILHYLASTALMARAFHIELVTPLWVNALTYVGAIAILEIVMLVETERRDQGSRYEVGAWLAAIILLASATLADPADGKFFPVGAVLIIVAGLIPGLSNSPNRTTVTMLLEISSFAAGLVVQPETTWLAAAVGVGLAGLAIVLTGRTPYWDLGKENLDE